MQKIIELILNKCRLLYSNRIDDVTYVSKEGRDGYRYSESNSSLVIYAEMLSSSSKINVIVGKGSIDKWLPPHEREILTQEDKDRILEKFCLYLAKRNTTFEVR